jgi:hypothetical protein
VLANLKFTALPHPTSAIVPLRVSNLAGLRTTGQPVAHAAAHGGRVIVVATEPVLDSVRQGDGTLGIMLYGQPGANHRIEAAHELLPDAWFPLTNWTLADRWQLFQVPPPTNRPVFYRARQE